MKYDIIFLGDGIMKYIFNFFNNTTLTAGQQIAVSVISAFIMIVLTPVLKNIYCKLSKPLEPIKEKYQRNKRIKAGKITLRDAKYLLSKEKGGQELSPKEKETLKMIHADLIDAGEKMVELGKISRQINNTNIPKL
mgnify:CR=1 FL=1